jgi:hypothetical protein
MPVSNGRDVKPPPRISARDAVIAAACIVGLIGVAIFLAQRPSNKQTGQLYANLPFDAAQADLAFQARVAAAFPLPAPEETLVKALSSQGFHETSPRRMALRDWVTRHSPTCGFDASVAWEVDDLGRVTALQAHYLRALGCVEK